MSTLSTDGERGWEPEPEPEPEVDCETRTEVGIEGL